MTIETLLDAMRVPVGCFIGRTETAAFVEWPADTYIGHTSPSYWLYYVLPDGRYRHTGAANVPPGEVGERAAQFARIAVADGANPGDAWGAVGLPVEQPDEVTA